jgi:TolB-like protein
MMGPFLLGALLVMQAPQPATNRPSVAVLKIVAAKGVDPSVTDLLGQALVAKVKAYGRFESTVGFNDIETLLSFERQKQLLQCEASSCMAEIAGALGVQYIISSSVGRLGSVWLFNAQLIDTRTGKAEGSATEKIKGNDESALVDALDRIVPQLLGGKVPAVATPANNPKTPVTPAPPPPAQGGTKSWDDLGVDDIKRPKKTEREIPELPPAPPPILQTDNVPPQPPPPRAKEPAPVAPKAAPAEKRIAKAPVEEDDPPAPRKKAEKREKRDHEDAHEKGSAVVTKKVMVAGGVSAALGVWTLLHIPAFAAAVVGGFLLAAVGGQEGSVVAVLCWGLCCTGGLVSALGTVVAVVTTASLFLFDYLRPPARDHEASSRRAPCLEDCSDDMRTVAHHEAR